MSFDTIDADLAARLKPLVLRMYLLDQSAREGLLLLLEQIVPMLENERGCTLTYADLAGDGCLSILALGNKDLVRPLMQVAEDYNIAMKHEGTLQ